MAGSVIVAGARTPIGKLSGVFAGFSAADLGAVAIKAALERAGLAPDQVDYVLMGQVVQAGAGQTTTRKAAAGAGIPLDVPSATINKVCLSGMNAIHLADLMVRAGEAEIVVAGGMESMTQAPYVLPGARQGLRLGDAKVLDALYNDALTSNLDGAGMGESTDANAKAAGISRERQDELAALSHERAAAATKDGRLAAEIVPVQVPQRRGDPMVVEHDEGIRPETTVEGLAKLRPVFAADGTITAGNASQISDGAAAVVVTSAECAEEMGLRPIGEIVGYGQVAGAGQGSGPATSLLPQPSGAIRDALERSGLTLGEIDLFEINEAFAAVAAAAIDDLGVSQDVVNVNGGAVALGHPVGMSGARLVVTLLYELGRRGGGLGAASLCGGGGQGDAMLVRSLK
jgi:acetyl-CoA C-acetyltransferase